MKGDISKYELLLIKELEGELSSEERFALDEWLLVPDNQVIYAEHKKLWTSADDLRKMKLVDTKKALRKVEAKLFDKFSMSWFKRLEQVAAILFIPLLLSSLWFFYDSYSVSNADIQLACNTIEIPSGAKSKLTLPDGTSVWLNAGSSLKYPVNFIGTTRNVELNGEAFFEVTKNKKKPFVVSAGDLNIRVLGTKFNCCAYAGSETIETALIEGSVELSGKHGERKFTMSPGELAVFSCRKNTLKKSTANLDKYVAWKSGKLMFRDDPMERVIDKLGKWYGVEFQVEDRELLKYTYSATFSGESLDQLLKMLALSAPINYEFLPKGNTNNTDGVVQIVKLTKKQKKGDQL